MLGFKMRRVLLATFLAILFLPGTLSDGKLFSSPRQRSVAGIRDCNEGIDASRVRSYDKQPGQHPKFGKTTLRSTGRPKNGPSVGFTVTEKQNGNPPASPPNDQTKQQDNPSQRPPPAPRVGGGDGVIKSTANECGGPSTINELRAKYGKGPIKWSSQLGSRSQDLNRMCGFSHSCAESAEILYRESGYGNKGCTFARATKGWEKSQGHFQIATSDDYSTYGCATLSKDNEHVCRCMFTR